MHAKFQASSFNGVGGERGDRRKEGQTTILVAIHNGISNYSHVKRVTDNNDLEKISEIVLPKNHNFLE